MVNDTDRNSAYAAWLRWALQQKKKQTRTPSSPIRVLDIGAGSGLLGLMAARFASELGVEVEVVCLEKVPVLAAAAGWAVEENGVGEQVTVVNELSSDVTAEDLGASFFHFLYGLVVESLRWANWCTHIRTHGTQAAASTSSSPRSLATNP